VLIYVYYYAHLGKASKILLLVHKEVKLCQKIEDAVAVSDLVVTVAG